MAWILTVELVRPSDGQIIKVNANEAIFYTRRGFKRADDVSKTSGGEQLILDVEATADSDINAIHDANAKPEAKQFETDDDNLNNIII